MEIDVRILTIRLCWEAGSKKQEAGNWNPLACASGGPYAGSHSGFRLLTSCFQNSAHATAQMTV